MRPSTVTLSMLLILLATSWALPVRAHEPGLSQSSWRRSGDLLEVEIGMAPAELALLGDSADADGDLRLTQAELLASRELLASHLATTTQVWNGAGPCHSLSSQLVWIDPSSVQFSASYRCVGDGTVQARLDWLPQLGTDHRHWATLRSSAGQQRLLLHAADTVVRGVEPRSALAQYTPIVASGAEHIVFGLDHLAFLCGLMLAGGRLRGQVLGLTGFSVAHSITLGLMVGGYLAAPGALIEPLIGLSVLAVALANLLRWSTGGLLRWSLVLGFGLIHGFGFAGAVAAQAPAQEDLLPWLIAFNVGVELGQLAFVLAVVGATAQLRHLLRSNHLQYANMATNVALLGLGGYWIVDRVMA